LAHTLALVALGVRRSKILLTFIVSLTGKFRPVAAVENSKYGRSGLCSGGALEGLNLPADVASNLAELANFGVADNTWGTYRTADKMRKRCQEETGQNLQLPWGQRETLIFVNWLDTVRKVSGGTINVYLAGIKTLHCMNGWPAPLLKDQLVKTVIKGKMHRDLIKKTGPEKADLPVTITLLKLLKERLRESQMLVAEQRLLWAVSSIAFYGSFRIHEILAKNESFYDPRRTLLQQDVTVVRLHVQGVERQALAVKVKAPKESKLCRDIVVDIFDTNDETCPVRAFKKWAGMTKPDPVAPLFSSVNGTPLTGAKFNKVLTALLQKDIDFERYNLTSRSFRRGLATLLAHKGLAEDELKAIGRWSSRAFEHYTKLPRTKRAALAANITKF